MRPVGRTSWRSGLTGRIASFLAASLVGATATLAVEAAPGQPSLQTNQALIEELQKGHDLDPADIGSAFAFVLSQLPPEVTVYPTENYYYYRFLHGGIAYAGNIRLAAVDRDEGIVHFAMFAAANAGSGAGPMLYKPLTEADGVTLEKLGPLAYRIDFRGTSVVFRLNDVGDVRPPPGYLNASEDYIGPVFDESGIEFYLVFNRDLRLFHYILNATRPVQDELRPAAYTDAILIGRRTGFAFYRDRADRLLLIGVLDHNVVVNNYFDGPFDQLPDNFIDGDTLKIAIETYDPSVAGTIDRYGFFDNGAGRYLIGPYMQYRDVKELVQFHLCATDPALAPTYYYACFIAGRGG